MKRGEQVTLPRVKASSAYRYYWIQKDGNVDRRYNPGAKYRVAKDITFCLKRYKVYKISFLTSSGRREYTDIGQNAVKGV